MFKKMRVLITVILIFSMQFTCVFALPPEIEAKAQKLVERGWVKGRSNSKNLDLDKNITRAEVAKIICFMYKPDAKSYPTRFTDVKPNFWAAKYINYLAQENFISGYSDGSFRPNNPITYDELIAILVRSIPNYEQYIDSSKKPSTWAGKYLYAADDMGLFDDAYVYSTAENANRGYAFAILDNWYNILSEVRENDYRASKVNTQNKPPQNTNPEADKYQSYSIDTNSGTKTIVGYYPDFEDKLLELVNKERTSRGLNPLEKGVSSLDKMATIRAREISYLFEHEKPDNRNIMVDIDSNEYEYTLGENIAWGQSTPEDVMNCWMISPGHRDNILGEAYDSVSQKCFKQKDGTYFWVQVFSKKRVSNTYNNGFDKDTSYNEPASNQPSEETSNTNKLNKFKIELPCTALLGNIEHSYYSPDDVFKLEMKDVFGCPGKNPDDFIRYEIVDGNGKLQNPTSYEDCVVWFLSPGTIIIEGVYKD